jgi:hypothetical protein
MMLRPIAPAALVVFLMASSALPASPADEESRFIAENDAAMTRMMNDMNVKPSGDIDRDFAAMMIPHHQGAIDMAVIMLRYGHNEQLRRVAQEIIVEQQQEIDAMRLAVGLPPSPAAAAPTQPQSQPSADAGMGGTTHDTMHHHGQAQKEH